MTVNVCVLPHYFSLYLQSLMGSMMDIRWHFIGRLQKKNTKKLVGKSRQFILGKCDREFMMMNNSMNVFHVLLVGAQQKIHVCV